jgi:hypothetical protein
VAMASGAHRRRSRATSLLRKRPAASSHAEPEPPRCAVRPIVRPTHRAARSSLRMKITTAAATVRIPIPITAPDNHPSVDSPRAITSATAARGRASFTAKFAMPVEMVTSPTSVAVKPHEVYIEYDTPMAMAPPPGSVMATDVDDWFTSAARAGVRPGIPAIRTGQYVTTLSRVRATRTTTSAGDMSEMTRHTSSMSARCGNAPKKTPITMAGNRSARTTRRVRLRFDRVEGMTASSHRLCFASLPRPARITEA